MIIGVDLGLSGDSDTADDEPWLKMLLLIIDGLHKNWDSLLSGQFNVM